MIARTWRTLARVAAAAVIALGAACGGEGADRPARADVARPDRAAVEATADDSLVSRALAANALEQGRSSPGDAGSQQPRPATGASSDARAFGPSVGFRSRARLDEHYIKHGAEFGIISRDDYLRQAQALRDAPVGGAVLELRRGDGTVSRFDRASGGFVAFDADGIIRTYFRPNDGEAYFRRQARRRPDR